MAGGLLKGCWFVVGQLPAPVEGGVSGKVLGLPCGQWTTVEVGRQADEKGWHDSGGHSEGRERAGCQGCSEGELS